MSGSPLTSFAIGSLAASRGASDLAELSASLFRPKGAPLRAAPIDAVGVLQAARELSEYVESQNRYIADLEREVRELRAHSERVENDRDELRVWAAWAEAELKRRPKAD